MVEFNSKKIGIGSRWPQSEVEEAFTNQDIRAISNSLTSSLTAKDRSRINTLDATIKEKGIGDADIEDIIELSIRRVGSADAGNGEMATDIIRHGTDADANAIKGWNLRTQSGLVGVSLPTQTWNAEVKKQGFLAFFGLLTEQNRIAIGDEKTFLQDVMFLKKEGKWIIAGKDGRILENDKGKSFEFNFEAIESPFRGELKNINEGLALKGAEIISTKIEKVPAGVKPFALGAEVEIATEFTPAQQIRIEDLRTAQGGKISQNQIDVILKQPE